MAKSFIVDLNIPKDTISSLKTYGNVYFTETLRNVYQPVNTHPDIQIFFADKNTVFTTDYLKNYYKDIFTGEICVKGIGQKIGNSYPENVLFNIASFGKYIVCNKKYASEDILNYCKDKTIISVNQGYTKCNICIVSDNAVITEDKGIYNELIKYNIDVLLINPGGVKLDNFEYGFIGGASGFINNDTIGFIGRLENHPQFNEIRDFIHKHNKEFVSLGNGGLADFGSILMF